MSGIINASIIVFVSVIILMGILPSFIIPALYGDYFNGYLSSDWLAGFLGVPSEVVSWPNIVWYTAFPLMATIAIIYGFMEELRIFRNAPNSELIYMVIAVAWSFLLIRTGALGMIGKLLYRVGALTAVIVFTTVFILGVVMFGISEVRKRL